MATLGDPLADLAALVMFWDERGRRSTDHQGPHRFRGFLTSGQVVDRYGHATELVVDILTGTGGARKVRFGHHLEQIHVRLWRARHVAGFDSVATWSVPATGSVS